MDVLFAVPKYQYRRTICNRWGCCLNWHRPVQEKEYILSEARSTFRMNAKLSDPDAIALKV
jgi:hypothetical protein